MSSRHPLHTRLYYAFWHRLEGAVVSAATDEAVAALTFDDGPHPDFTPRLLEVLARHGARATFFMVGQAAARYPQVVRQVAEAGHAIGNHGWDHPSFPTLSHRQRWAQLRQAERALAPYGSKLFRPPFGHLDRPSHLDVRLMGYTVAGWNITGYDWLDHDPTWISQHIQENLRPGSIILLHDAAWVTLDQGWADRGPMLEAVEHLLNAVARSASDGPAGRASNGPAGRASNGPAGRASNGPAGRASNGPAGRASDGPAGRASDGPATPYRFVTLPELLRLGRPQLRIWQKPADPAFMAQLQPVGSRK